MKNKIFLSVVIITLFSIISNCQITKSQTFSDVTKIDSVFNFNFEVLEIELIGKVTPKDKPEFYDYFIDTESNDTVYFGKYVGAATLFMEEITGIKRTISKGDHQYTDSRTLNAEIIEKWKKWYSENKNRITWDSQTNKPVLKE